MKLFYLQYKKKAGNCGFSLSVMDWWKPNCAIFRNVIRIQIWFYTMAGGFHEIINLTLSEVIITNEQEQRYRQKVWDCLWGDQMDCILLFSNTKSNLWFNADLVVLNVTTSVGLRLYDQFVNSPIMQKLLDYANRPFQIRSIKQVKTP